MKYTGSKGGSGVVEWLINNVPYHERYHELFVGIGKLYYAKKPAETSYLTDLNPVIIEYHKGNGLKNTFIEHGSALYNLIEERSFYQRPRDFIYLDPPYPPDARRDPTRELYDYEMLTNEQHEELLLAARAVDANIMISTRQNALYDSLLHDWRKERFRTCDRGGVVYEIIYMNYDRPAILHQYDYLGDGKTRRQMVTRKIDRFENKIQKLPLYERQLLLQTLIAHSPREAEHFLSQIRRR